MVNSRKKLKTGRSGAIGRLDLPEGRELKEEEEKVNEVNLTEETGCELGSAAPHARCFPLPYHFNFSAPHKSHFRERPAV